MRIGSKILAGFAAAVALAVGVGVVGYFTTRRMGQQLAVVADARFPSIVVINDLNAAVREVLRGMDILLIRQLGVGEQHQQGYFTIDNGLQQIDDASRAFEALPHSDEELAAWNGTAGPLSEWEHLVQAVVELQKEQDRLTAIGKPATAPDVKDLETRVLDAWRAQRKSLPAIQQPLDELVSGTRARVQEERADAVRSERWTGALLLACILAGAVALAALGRYVAADIGKLFASISGHLDLMAKGDIPPPLIESRGEDFNSVRDSLNTCISAVNMLILDTTSMAKQAVSGQLEARSDAERHQGDYQKIVQGVNDTLDAMIAPMHEIASVLDRLAAGELGARGDPARYQNASRQLVDSVNRTLDTLMAPTEEATRVLSRLARRDLRARMTGAYQGGHATMKDVLNATAESLHGALMEVADSVDLVSGASDQIASSSQVLANGASEQASALEETSASLHAISSMTHRSADHAGRAAVRALDVRSVATEGVAATEEMTSAMARIRTSAEGTSQIIKDINEIAFQTNLLALNAAVEAARAGEAGRGFAVVAEEVRSLASRSKAAANRTEALIRQSIAETNDGESTAKNMTEKWSRIMHAVAEVADIVSEIASTAKEQAVGVEQVNKGVNEVEKVTQLNASSSEEGSSTAHQLSEHARRLSALVATFMLERGAGALHGPAGGPSQPEPPERPAAMGAVVPFPAKSRSPRRR
jgi:methyl-accepting chemotaxis protein